MEARSTSDTPSSVFSLRPDQQTDVQLSRRTTENAYTLGLALQPVRIEKTDRTPRRRKQATRMSTEGAEGNRERDDGNPPLLLDCTEKWHLSLAS